MSVTAAPTSETPRHPVFARLWTRASRQLDKQGGAEHRRRLLDGLQGRVIEVGAGEGRNFGHYPDAVTEVVAVEPEPYLQTRAEDAAAQAPVPVRVVAGGCHTARDTLAAVDHAGFTVTDRTASASRTVRCRRRPRRTCAARR